MSDYYTYTKTNYFSVTDEEKFRQIVSMIECNDDIEIYVVEENNKKEYLLCAYGCFVGIDNTVDCSGPDIEVMYKEFQKILPDGEVMVIFESGHEKLRDVTGCVTVITNQSYEIRSLWDIANELAKELTGNLEFELSV